MTEWLGLGLSYLFIFAVIAVAQGLLATGRVQPSGTRKIVHIGVAHWWIIAMLFISHPAIAFIGPVSFVGINYWSWRTHAFAAMEHEDHRRNLGTIWFPVALVMLVSLTFTGLFPRWYGLLAILVLGWGDGLASVIGERWGQRPGALRFSVPGGEKSVSGSVAMFAAAFVVTTIVLTASLYLGLPHIGVLPLAGSEHSLLSALRSAAEGTWLAQPTERLALVALSRLDLLATVVVEQATSGVGGSLVDTAVLPLAPTTIIAIAVIIASVATAVELITPWGLDNISIPVITFVVLAVLMTMPQEWVIRLAWALSLNILVAVVAYLRRSVTASGAIAGAAVGLLIYLSGGLFFWSVLMAFFFSSSLLSKITGNGRKAAAEAMHEKGSRRDAVQVLANGGLAAVMAVAYGVTGSPFFLLGFGITMAAANADTWASEIGVLSRRPPISILTLRPVPPGTSGGVSLLGFGAALAGALGIALWFAGGYLLSSAWNGVELITVVGVITVGGFLGAVIDSVLGATVQAQYWDATGEGITERRSDAQGTPNRLTRGLPAVNNDVVNALSGLLSALVFVILLQ